MAAPESNRSVGRRHTTACHVHKVRGRGANGPPGFVALAGDVDTGLYDLPGDPICDDLPSIRVYGESILTDFYHVRCDATDMLVFGHCLVADTRLASEFSAAIRNRNLDAIATWPGAYAALVVSDTATRVYADLAGQFAVYYSRRGGRVLIGSDPRLLATIDHRQIDPVTAAVRIACPAVLPLWSRRSPHRDVERLEGGGVLEVTSGSVHVSAYDSPAPIDRISLADGAMTLRNALTEQIGARCEEGPVSSDFSGGLDSTSVAILAARHSERHVPAVVYHQPLAPAADLAEAMRCSRLEPRIDLRVVRGTDETLPYRALAQAYGNGGTWSQALPQLAEPAAAALTWRRSALRLAAVSSCGARLHLTGEGGDALMTAAPSYLGSLARWGSMRTLLRHCGAYARLRNTSRFALFRRALHLRACEPKASLEALARELEQPRRRRLELADAIGWWPPCGEAATWLTRRMRRHLAELAADPAVAKAIGPYAGPADMAALTELRTSGDTQRHLRDLGHRFGLSVQAPYLDNGVVRVALSIPSTARADPWSYKPLLRAALGGVVPDEVLCRATKGDYSAEEYLGARRSMPALRHLMQDSRLAALGVIEPGVVQATLDRMSTGIAVPVGSLNTLLSTEVWLRAIDSHDAEEKDDARITDT